MHKNKFLISVVISILLTVYLWNICPSFVKGVGRLVYSYGYNIPSWELFHGVFALSFGLIPFWSFLIWRFGKYSSVFSLIIHSLSVYAVAIFASGYIFVKYVESHKQISPWLPKYAPSTSSWGELFMNYVFPASVLVPLLGSLIIAAIKQRNVVELGELDQSVES